MTEGRLKGPHGVLPCSLEEGPVEGESTKPLSMLGKWSCSVMSPCRLLGFAAAGWHLGDHLGEAGAAPRGGCEVQCLLSLSSTRHPGGSRICTLLSSDQTG